MKRYVTGDLAHCTVEETKLIVKLSHDDAVRMGECFDWVFEDDICIASMTAEIYIELNSFGLLLFDCHPEFIFDDDLKIVFVEYLHDMQNAVRKSYSRYNGVSEKGKDLT